MPNEDEVAARYRGNLEQFVLRARRIAAHSLAADWDALVALAAGTYTVSVTGDGEARIRLEYPPEEVVESAAARVRPIMLNDDPCFYLSALAGLGYFCRAQPQDLAWIKAARNEWRTRAETLTADGPGYQVMIGDAATGDVTGLDDRSLAKAWLYGDVVHHNTELRREADPFGLGERFRAAVPRICWTMICAIELLRFIEALQSAGVLDLDPGVFEHEIVLKSTTWEQTGRVYTAEAGTAPPTDALEPFGNEWTLLKHPDDLTRPE